MVKKWHKKYVFWQNFLIFYVIINVKYIYQ